MLLAVAEQCAQALDRARLYRAEQGIAETLQRSLLPAGAARPRAARAGRPLPARRRGQPGRRRLVRRGRSSWTTAWPSPSATSWARDRQPRPSWASCAAPCRPPCCRAASRPRPWSCWTVSPPGCPGALASTAACLVVDGTAGTVTLGPRRPSAAAAGHGRGQGPLPGGAGSGTVLGRSPAGRRTRRARSRSSPAPRCCCTPTAWSSGAVSCWTTDWPASRRSPRRHASADPVRLTDRLLADVLADTDQPDDVAVIAARLLPAPAGRAAARGPGAARRCPPGRGGLVDRRRPARRHRRGPPAGARRGAGQRGRARLLGRRRRPVRVPGGARARRQRSTSRSPTPARGGRPGRPRVPRAGPGADLRAGAGRPGHPRRRCADRVRHPGPVPVPSGGGGPLRRTPCAPGRRAPDGRRRRLRARWSRPRTPTVCGSPSKASSTSPRPGRWAWTWGAGSGNWAPASPSSSISAPRATSPARASAWCWRSRRGPRPRADRSGLLTAPGTPPERILRLAGLADGLGGGAAHPFRGCQGIRPGDRVLGHVSQNVMPGRRSSGHDKVEERVDSTASHRSSPTSPAQGTRPAFATAGHGHAASVVASDARPAGRGAAVPRGRPARR